jgi:hypothetical protein
MIPIEIESAIAAHRMWSKRLRHIIDGVSQDRVTPAFIGNYTRCVLGEWLHGEGAKYEGNSEYAKLLETHKIFHEVAENILTLHLAGNSSAADLLLNGEFEILSTKVVNYLQQLRDEGLR